MGAPREAGRRRPSWLTGNVLALGLVSLFTDTATEMVVPMLPVFLTQVLGAGALALGWIEGAADSASSLLKLLSGRIADRVGRNRPLVLAGYTLSSAVKPLLALATNPWHVLAVRLTDRAGKGIRSSPRDALIAGSVAPEALGRAFGFHRAMDHTGAVLGPLLAVVYLTWVSDDLRILFALAAIPAALTVAALVLGVREAPRDDPPTASAQGVPAAPDRRLRCFLIPLALFTLANSSDTFLLLRAAEAHAPWVALPLLWAALHVVKALASIPGGRLADRWGRARTVQLGWGLYAVVYAALAWVESAWATAGLLVLYGIYYGLTEGPEKALVAERSPARGRATAFGWYHLTVGLLALPSSLIFGAMWTVWGSATAFLVSAGASASAALLFAGLEALERRTSGGGDRRLL